PRATPMEPAAPATLEEKPLVDAGGHLLVDARLHGLFDTYLLQARGAGARDARAREVRAWLGNRLAQPALGEADALLKAYVGYLQAEDDLRAHARFTRPDPAGLTDAQVDQMVAGHQM